MNPNVVVLLGCVFVWIIGFFQIRCEMILKRRELFLPCDYKRKKCRILIRIYKDIKLYSPAKTSTVFDVNSQGDVFASLNII